MLAAAVEVLVAGEIVEARAAAEELRDIADARRPAAARRVGVRQRHGPARRGRRAAPVGAAPGCAGAGALEMPYDAARAGAGRRACRALGDHDAAT